MALLLEEVNDGKEHKWEDVVERMALRLQLGPEERARKTGCGRQLQYKNRSVLARTKLIQDGLLVAGAGKRTVALTAAGREG